MKGNGDFRSEECIKYLEEADIVVTNPPFSLIQEYIEQLLSHKKKFIFLGDHKMVTYRKFFQHFMKKKVWLGPSKKSGGCRFEIPRHLEAISDNVEVDEHGRKFIEMDAIRWFTNLNFKSRLEDLPLYREYSSSEYPHYEDIKAIEVGSYKEIPKDYPGLMGVPISLLSHHNPKQFEIVDMATPKLRLPSGQVKTQWKRILVRNLKVEKSS